MAEQLELPLPEISMENFSRSWTRFELVAKAKEWNEAKQQVVIPTLLRGELLDLYLGLSEDKKELMAALKAALAERSGVTKHPLLVCKLFAEKNQGTHQTIAEYATELSKLFQEAHPSEDVSSTVLLNRFLSGLKPAVGQQVLFKEQPRTLAAAVKIAREVEFALQFGQGQAQEEISTVCALQTQQLAQQESIDKLTNRN